MQLTSNALRMLGTLLAVQILTGCKKSEQLELSSSNHKPIITDALSELFPFNNKAIVVIRCKPEFFKEGKWHSLTYRVSEIWRDESEGVFTNKIGDLIPNVGELPVTLYFKSSSSAPKQDVIMFLRYNDEGLRPLLTSAINIHDTFGEYSGIGGNLERVKQLIMTTTSSKEKCSDEEYRKFWEDFEQRGL